MDVGVNELVVTGGTRHDSTIRNDEDGEEDQLERFEFEIEDSVAEFIDEPRIRHDIYPDSDNDVEENVDVHFKENNQMRQGDGELYKGQIFYNGVAFKEGLLNYALKSGRNIKQYRYDKTNLGFDCAMRDGCQWRIYCSLVGKIGKWQVIVFKDSYTFILNGECEMLKVPVIARLFLDKIRDESKYMMPMKIKEILKERWKLTASRSQCQAARLKALKWIDGEYNEQFGRLRDYGSEIVDANPESSVEIETLINDEGQDVFNMFYVCFAILKRSWKETCRPLIGVYGCFLRGRMKGQLLVVLGKDANNSMYPIAWAVVQVENTENWLWFVKKIKLDLGLKDGEGFVMVLDRQKGLIKAVELKLPKIEHRNCVRHIYANLKANHGKKTQLKPLLWKLAWSYNESNFNENLDRLRCYDTKVYEDVMKAKPRSWCRAFYETGSFCEDVENNSTESFNSSIVKAREKPLVPMLETIRRLFMVRIAKRSLIANNHLGKCTPYVENVLAKEHESVAACKVYVGTNETFEVNLSGCSYRVSLEKRTCSCRKWDITGIPCEHAYGVIIDKRLHVDGYVYEKLHTTFWRSTYATSLKPLKGAHFWPRGTSSLVTEPLEPPQTGRKKKSKRKKGKNESPLKKNPKNLKRIMHCRICNKVGHNLRFHNKDAFKDVGCSVSQSEGGRQDE